MIAFMARGMAGSNAVFRVRIGPIGGVDEYDRLTALLDDAGIRDVRLVSEPTLGTQ